MTIGLIGFGKIAKLIVEVLQQKDKTIKFKIFSIDQIIDNVRFFSLEEVCASDVVIPAVPIREFENVIKQISKSIKPNSIVIDVCSIKVHPKRIMLVHLPESVQIITTHPMFGPESYKNNNNSVEGLNLVIENVRCNSEIFNKLLNFLIELKLNVVQMSADEHDKQAANFQFISMFVGLMMKNTEFKESSIETLSAKRIRELSNAVGQDLVILQDMYKFNPYCKDELAKLNFSFHNLKDLVTQQ